MVKGLLGLGGPGAGFVRWVRCADGSEAVAEGASDDVEACRIEAVGGASEGHGDGCE